jgi:hypothetical protein
MHGRMDLSHLPMFLVLPLLLLGRLSYKAMRHHTVLFVGRVLVGGCFGGCLWGLLVLLHCMVSTLGT